MARQTDLFEAGVAETRAAFAAVPLAVEEQRRRGVPDVASLAEAEILQRLLARTRPATAASLADGIGRVVGAPAAYLARIVGDEVAGDLELLHDLLLRALEFPLRRRDVLSSWDAVKTYLCARLRACPREAVHVLFLDKKDQLIADERLGEGTVDHAPVYPREAVRRALEHAHAFYHVGDWYVVEECWDAWAVLEELGRHEEKTRVAFHVEAAAIAHFATLISDRRSIQ